MSERKSWFTSSDWIPGANSHSIQQSDELPAFVAIRSRPIAFYGPDDKRASKAAVAILNAQGAEPTALERWFAEEGDVRTDPAVGSDILQFVRDHGAKSVVMTDRIIGCPHEEGIDYPDGQVCPRCPFWAVQPRPSQRSI